MRAEADDISYAVTGSSNDELISDAGLLLKQPGTSTDVELTVTIAAKAKPAIKTEVKVKVTLPAIYTGGGGGSGGIILPAAPAASTNYALSAVVSKGLTQASVKPELKTDGNIVSASVSDADLQQALTSSPVAVVVPVTVTASQQAQFSLTASQVALLAASNAANTIVITNGTSAIALPVSILAKVAKNAGLQVTLAGSDQSTAFTNAVPGITVLGTPVAFNVSTVQGTTVTPLPLSGKALIKQAFILAKGVDAKAAGVLYLSGQTASPAPAAFTSNDDGTTTVTVTRPGFSTYAAVTRSVGFTDLGSTSAKDKIEALASKFLIDGTSNATFSPNASVTRAEFAAMLTRALGLQGSGSAPFTDVTADKWYADEVAAAYQAGLITGLGDGSFKPNGTITHQDLAVMLERAASLVRLQTNGVASPTYADAAAISGYAKDSVVTVSAGGLMSGTETNGSLFFTPKSPSTRAEAATAIYNLLKQSGLIN